MTRKKPLAQRVPHRPRTGAAPATPRRPLGRQFLIKPRTAPDAAPVSTVSTVAAVTEPTTVAESHSVTESHSVAEPTSVAETHSVPESHSDADTTNVAELATTPTPGPVAVVPAARSNMDDAMTIEAPVLDALPDEEPGQFADEVARGERAVELARLDMRAAEVGAELDRLNRLSAEIDAQRNALEV